MTKAFNELGISIEDLETLTPDQLLEKIAHSSLNAADLVKVLGRGAIALRPALEGIGDGSLKAGREMQEGLIDSMHQVDVTLKELMQTVRVWYAETIGTVVKGADYLGTEVEVIFANIAQQVDLAKTAIRDFLKFDFSGLGAKSDAAAAGTAGEALRDQFRQRYAPSTPTPLKPHNAGGIDDEDDLLSAVKGGGKANGGGGKGGGDGEARENVAIYERLAKVERERYLDSLSKGRQLEAIDRERGALQHYLNDGKRDGTLSDEEAANVQLEIYNRDSDIHKINLSIAEAKTKSVEEEQKLREEAAAHYEEQQRQLAAAHEQTIELQLERAGHADIAEVMRTKFEFQVKVNAARNDGNEALARELESQQKISVEMLQQKQAQEAAAKAAQNAANAAAAAERAAVAQKAANVRAKAKFDSGEGNGINLNDPIGLDYDTIRAMRPDGSIDEAMLLRLQLQNQAKGLQSTIDGPNGGGVSHNPYYFSGTEQLQLNKKLTDIFGRNQTAAAGLARSTAQTDLQSVQSVLANPVLFQQMLSELQKLNAAVKPKPGGA